MSDELATAAVQPERHLVALTPGDMPEQQAKLAAWCDRRIASLKDERNDLAQNVRIAKKNKWAWKGLMSHVRLAQKRIVYYEKIKAAVAEGYLVVPNFDCQIMAVRVDSARQRGEATYALAPEVREARPELLPVGEGRYVDDTMFSRNASYNEPDGKGGTRRVGRYFASGFDNHPDFPVQFVKPIVLEATAHAMALKIFDRIGVVTGKKKDPVVIGQIIDPRCRYLRQPDRMLSFFIAWWLDTETL